VATSSHAFVANPRGNIQLPHEKLLPAELLNKVPPSSSSFTQLHQTSPKTSTIFKSPQVSVDDVLKDNSKDLILQQDQEGQKIKPAASGGDFSYGDFAKKYPFMNNIIIASTKTAAADLMAQVVIAQTPFSAIEWDRTFLFLTFGAIYLGGFQYFYQVNIFKKLFDVDKFTSQSWSDKLNDVEGLKALAAQTALDLFVLTLVYLPTFYVFKEGVFSGSMDPTVWMSSGIEKWQQNFSKDELDLIRVWMPADLVCFSVPLYLRLPVRHVVSFMWTAYLSFVRGGH
jgi:hypothetical protein